MYRYIQIGSDDSFSHSLPRERLVNVMKSLPECVVDTRHSFKNAEGLPWFRINIGICDAEGNYAANPAEISESMNMVELICAERGDQKTREFFDQFAGRISNALGWNAFSSNVHEAE